MIPLSAIPAALRQPVPVGPIVTHVVRSDAPVRPELLADIRRILAQGRAS